MICLLLFPKSTLSVTFQEIFWLKNSLQPVRSFSEEYSPKILREILFRIFLQGNFELTSLLNVGGPRGSFEEFASSQIDFKHEDGKVLPVIDLEHIERNFLIKQFADKPFFEINPLTGLAVRKVFKLLNNEKIPDARKQGLAEALKETKDSNGTS